MQITTASFAPDGPIGLRYVGRSSGGENINPELTWTDPPEGTKSFAVTIYDPDAPTGSGFWHWIVVNIPASVRSIAEGAGAPEGAIEAPTDYGHGSYGGPNPPAGPPHRYVHTVHALPVEHIEVDSTAPHVQARFKIHTQQIASASVTGTFQNH